MSIKNRITVTNKNNLYRPLSWAAVCGSLLLAVPGVADSAPEREPKVLIIGVDGLRPDALEQAATPNIDRLIASGAYTSSARILRDYRENDTVSGASWSSILTGVWANKHGVHDNSFEGKNFPAYPHFFERVKAAKPDAQTVSLVSWEEIDKHIVSGADVRHVERLPAGDLVDFAVSAGDAGIDTRDGKWHHLVGLRREGVVSIFVDGRHLGSIEDRSGDFDLTGEFYMLGRDGRLDTGVFSGETEQVRIWNRALSPNEIAAVAGAGSPAARGWREPVEINLRGMVADLRGAIDKSQVPLSPEIAGITQGDWSLEAWVRSTNKGRNIVIGNHLRGRNSLNLELYSNNRVRIYMNPRWSRIDHEDVMDGNMAAAAAAVLRDQNPTAMFVYFHQTDLTGHTLGFSPEVPRYMNAVENVDRHIGRVVEALASRPTYEKEDWLVIVCTDHGGLGTRHGDGHDDPEIFTVPMILNGTSVKPGKIEEQVYLVDVVPTVLAHLGIEVDSGWGLDGRSLANEPLTSAGR